MASAVTKVFSALCYAAQQGRLERVKQLAPKMVKTKYGEKALAEGLEALCKQNISSVAIDPLTLEELNKAGKFFRQIREAQAKGIDANDIVFTA